MKTSAKISAFVFALLLVQVLVVSPAFSDTKAWVMTGKITAIDHQYHTVVVNVPQGKGQIFTVAGPLAPKAKVEKAGKMAALNNFNIGEKVTVKFHNLKDGQGPVITELLAAK